MQKPSESAARYVEPLSDQQVAEVTVRVRRRSFDEVYTVYLRDEDGNRVDSATSLDHLSIRDTTERFLDRLGVTK